MTEFEYYKLGIELLKILASVITFVLTIRWSLTKFLKEKKWEKKSEAYARIIEALHHMKHVIKNLIKSIEKGKSLDSFLDKEADRYKRARAELDKYFDIGKFYISDESLQELNKYFELSEEHGKAQEAGESTADILNDELKALSMCLENIKSRSIKELGTLS